MTNTPLDALRHTVTGAIERGEKEAIVEQKAKHTPIPWQQEHTKDKKVNSVDIYANNGACIATVRSNHGYETREANAAFIVKAVNCHDQLVEALQKIASGKITQEYLEDFCNEALAAAEAQ